MRRLLSIVILLLVIIFLGRCAWQNHQNRAPSASAESPSDTPASAVASSATGTAFIVPPPPPTVTFVMPALPPPPPPAAVEPVLRPVRPKPPVTPVRHKPVVRRAEPSAPAAVYEQSSPVPAPIKPSPAPTSQKSVAAAGASGAFYVIQQKLIRSGTYYVICTIMDNPQTQYFGYAVSADEYNNAVPGLVYNRSNMADWRQVARIQ